MTTELLAVAIAPVVVFAACELVKQIRGLVRECRR